MDLLQWLCSSTLVDWDCMSENLPLSINARANGGVTMMNVEDDGATQLSREIKDDLVGASGSELEFSVWEESQSGENPEQVRTSKW